MPLDSSFPTFHYEYDKEEPSLRRISYTSAGSSPQHLYHLVSNPDTPNSYLISLHDASFPEIQYGALTASLEFKTQTPPAPPKPQLPRTISLTLINPTSTLAISESSSYRRGGRYWKFRLPQRHETRTAEEIAKDPVMPVYLDFRWTTSAGRLHCWLKGRGDPDTQLATYSGVGKKKGMLEIYGSNVQRLDMDDKKGLEMVLVLSARAISDVYYTPMSIAFNVSETAADTTATTTPPVATVVGAKKTPPTAIFDPDEVARQKEAAKREAEELEKIRRMVEMEEAEERRRAEEKQKKEEEELEAVRELLRKEEEEERRKKREEERRVEEETERLRMKYMAPPRPGRGRREEAPPKPPRPRERGEGSWVGGGGSGGAGVPYMAAGGLVVEGDRRRLREGDRRKSFLGGLLGGGQGKKTIKKKQSEAW